MGVLQVYKDRKVVEQLVRRAEKAGFKAIALTVDTPRLGRREADIKNRFVLPPNLTLKNFEGLDLGKMDQVCTCSFFQRLDFWSRCALRTRTVHPSISRFWPVFTY
jgi:hypothetical protein